MAQLTDRQKTEIEWDQNAVPAFTAIAGGRRVRVIFGGQTVADSRRALLVLERQRLPVYYFPVEDVRREWLAPSGHQEPHSGHGAASYWTVTVGNWRRFQLRTRYEPRIPIGTTGTPDSSASRPIPGLASSAILPVRERPPSQYITIASPRPSTWKDVSNASSSWCPRRTGNTPP